MLCFQTIEILSEHIGIYKSNIISNYIDEKGKNIVVFDVDGKPIKAIKYDHGYYYPKEPKEKKIIIKQPKITYNKIKEYVKEKYNLNVHSIYIAEIKRNMDQICRVIELLKMLDILVVHLKKQKPLKKY